MKALGTARFVVPVGACRTLLSAGLETMWITKLRLAPARDDHPRVLAVSCLRSEQGKHPNTTLTDPQ